LSNILTFYTEIHNNLKVAQNFKLLFIQTKLQYFFGIHFLCISYIYLGTNYLNALLSNKTCFTYKTKLYVILVATQLLV